ncbi:MAG: aminopeptidase P family protein [Candidatus Kapabacteria bacterium]|nr:aminopeptidase P family protein [Ignavibacteriota bacterium]MCW5884116.1 aminopeptidase P family protein [Candidatus Kapabacteria bacterium]
MAKKIINQQTTNKYPKIVDRRLDQLRFSLEEQKSEAIAVSFMPNIRYLTNFSGSNALLFIMENEIHFVTDDTYEEQIKDELYQLPNLKTHITRDPWIYLVKNKVLKGVQGISFEADSMPYSEAVEIRNKIRPIKFKPADDLVSRFTQPKDPEELDCIKKSLVLSEQVYKYMLGFIKVGMSEIEVANEISHQCRLHGSEGEPQDIIVVSGPRCAQVNGNPSEKKIKKQELVIIDFGVKYKGYGTAVSRTVAMGRVTKEHKSVYESLKKARRLALKEVRPGMFAKNLDSICRNSIMKDGYGEYFKHGFGHGIGLQPIEQPIISYEVTEQMIPEECVIGVEPGIYMGDKYGIRAEDVFLVSKNGGELLLAAPEEIDVI